MIDKILKAIKYPNKTFRYILLIIKYLFRKKEGTLFSLGIDPNGILFPILISGYKKCYGFEPHPERYRTLCKKYNKYSNVYLYNSH